MIIVNLAPAENGAHQNQQKATAFKIIPSGWAAVPAALEEAAMAFMPWLALTVENGEITAIEENTAAKLAFEQAEAERLAEQEAQEKGDEE